MYDETIIAWCAAAECGDASAATACLAEDVELISPLTGQFRFHGRDEVAGLLAEAFQVLPRIRFHTRVGSGDTRALFFVSYAGRQPVEEAQLIRLDTDGLIYELTLFARPLPALTAVMADIGPRLMRRQGRRGFARVLGAAIAPLALLARLGEEWLVPLAHPRRGAPLRPVQTRSNRY
jgi:hypothetical protein